MGGKALQARIDRSDLAALKKAGARIELFFDASHPLKVKKPHFEINVWITEPQRAKLAKDAWGTCQKFFMHTDEIKRTLANRLKFESANFDPAFIGLNGHVKDAWKKLTEGGKASVIPVKLP